MFKKNWAKVKSACDKQMWNDMCGAAVFYGFHPSMYTDIVTVVSTFPRGLNI